MFDFMPVSLQKKIDSFVRNKSFIEVVSYIFWGILTTLINFFSYYFFVQIGLDYKIANILSMIITKSSAYVVNKVFVFKSHCKSLKDLCQEMGMFILSRGLSGVVDYVGLIILVDFLGVDKFWGKAFMIFFVTALNYFLGKKVVYKSR